MSSPLKLLTLKAPAPQFDPAKGAAGLPQRILVMPWGNNSTTQGPVIVNETTTKQLASYNAAQNWDRIGLDFEHSSVPGSPTYKGEPVKMAGYGKLEVVPGEGIYLLMSSWTPEGTEYAGGGHYGDLSPVVKVNASNEVIGLHSVALCRHGATEGLIFLSASTPPKSTMDPKMPQTADELAIELKTLLGLGADATPADIITAMKKQLADATALSAKTPGDNAEVKALTTKMDGMMTVLTAQSEAIKLLSTTQETSERGSIMAAAAAAGKQVPAMAAGLPIDKLKLLCAELPVTVPVGQRQTDATLLLSGGAHVDPELEKLDAEMGISKEDRAKFLKA